MVWFVVVLLGGLIGGGSGGAIGVFVGIPAAVTFYRKCGAKVNEVWNTKEIAERQRRSR